jgi:hypothetical protein
VYCGADVREGNELEVNMSALTWRSAGAVDSRQFSRARHQAHNAAQWLARMAHSYMVPKPEHRHTLLRWDTQRLALVTPEFLPKVAMELRLPNLAMQFLEDGRAVPHVLEIGDRTPAEVEAWVLVELLHRRLDRDRFSKSLPYEIPDLITGDAIPYMTETLEGALGELAAWFANAASVLARVGGEYRPGVLDACAVACWPEIFHMAVLLPARADQADTGPMLRAGLSVGNAGEPEPYFYVAPHNPMALSQPTCPDSVLTASAFSSSERPAQSVLEFLRQAIAINRERLANLHS